MDRRDTRKNSRRVLDQTSEAEVWIEQRHPVFRLWTYCPFRTPVLDGFRVAYNPQTRITQIRYGTPADHRTMDAATYVAHAAAATLATHQP